MWFPTFSRIAVLSFSWISLPFKVKRPQFSKIAGTIQPTKQCHNPKDPNPYLYHCESLISPNFLSFKILS
jgi:hypothetical protein